MNVQWHKFYLALFMIAHITVSFSSLQLCLWIGHVHTTTICQLYILGQPTSTPSLSRERCEVLCIKATNVIVYLFIIFLGSWYWAWWKNDRGLRSGHGKRCCWQQISSFEFIVEISIKPGRLNDPRARKAKTTGWSRVINGKHYDTLNTVQVCTR